MSLILCKSRRKNAPENLFYINILQGKHNFYIQFCTKSLVLCVFQVHGQLQFNILAKNPTGKSLKKNKVGKSKNFILDLSPYDKLEKIDPFLWPHGMVLFPFKNFGNKGISYID